MTSLNCGRVWRTFTFKCVHLSCVHLSVLLFILARAGQAVEHLFPCSTICSDPSTGLTVERCFLSRTSVKDWGSSLK